MSDAAQKPGPAGTHFAWVDTAKALLIFLVVLGHFHYSYAKVPAKELIYAFHVPAFLFITGFLLPADFGQLPGRVVLKRWIAVYLRAYAFFSVLAILLWWGLLSAKAGGPVNPMPAILGAAYGVAGASNLLVHQDQPLWYFPFLTVSLCGAWLAARLPALAGWGLILAWAAFSTVRDAPRLPWALDIGGMGALALFTGLKFRPFWPVVAPVLARPMPTLAIAVVSATMLVAVSGANGLTNLNGALFGRSGLLFATGMLAGCVMILAVASLIPPSRLLRAISGATLTIFALHIYLVRAVSAVLPRPASEAGRLVILLAASAAVVLACLLLSRLLSPVLDRLVVRRPSR